jgi:hypothetical protein
VQLLESIKNLSKHKNSSRLHFGHKWLTHFGFASGFSIFCHAFLDEILFLNVAHIDDLPFLGNVQVSLGIFSSCVIDLFISHGQYLSLLPFYLFKWISTKKLCRYVVTLWVQDHGNIFKAF